MLNFVNNYQAIESAPDTFVQLPSGLIVSERLAEAYMLSKRRPVAVDLFSGCGGFSCGVTQAGFDVIAAADNDASATITYLHNLGAYPCKIHCLLPERVGKSPMRTASASAAMEASGRRLPTRWRLVWRLTRA